MSNSKENQEVREPLSWLPIRWFIFFRLLPYAFKQPVFLFDIIIRHRRFPVLWDNVMETEKQSLLRKKEKEEIKNIAL